MRPGRVRRTIAVVVLVAAGCGGDSDVSADASAELRDRVAEIRTLAETRQTDELVVRIDELYALVERLRADGEISDEAAEEIAATVVAVRDNVSSITTTMAPPEEDNDDEGKDDEGKGKGNGNEGRGKDDDD